MPGKRRFKRERLIAGNIDLDRQRIDSVNPICRKQIEVPEIMDFTLGKDEHGSPAWQCFFRSPTTGRRTEARPYLQSSIQPSSNQTRFRVKFKRVHYPGRNGKGMVVLVWLTGLA